MIRELKDEAEEPIMLDEETMKHPTNEELHLGVFDFSNQYGLMKIGDNLYQPAPMLPISFKTSICISLNSPY